MSAMGHPASAAGAFALVLECIPAELARIVTDRLSIPTIGIGAGPHCDGQILVTHDMLGLYSKMRPKFVKQYADLHGEIACALSAFRTEVEGGLFPAPEHMVEMPDEEWEALLEAIGD